MPLSAKQMEYLAIAWQCFETEPKVDYDKFKTVANLASAASARELLRVTKKKLREEYGGTDVATTSTTDGRATPMPKTPASTRKRAAPKSGKKSATPAARESDDEEVTPVAKKARKKEGRVDSASPGKKVKVEETGHGLGEEGEGMEFIF